MKNNPNRLRVINHPESGIRNSALISAPGYRMNEYKLVIPLPEALEHKVSVLRKEFAGQYNHTADAGRAHLVLAIFSQHEMMEDRLLQRLNTIAMGESPFKIELRDFGSYPSHTIFVQVTTREPLKKLTRSLKDIQQILRMDKSHKPHFIDDPVVSIARKLKPWQYEKGWLEYSHRHFTGRFIADALLVLKRPEGSIPWQILRRMDMQNAPLMSKQQRLF